MITFFSVRNAAVIEASQVDFGPGLNIITGETGAGKSVFLRCLELLTGRRGSGDIVRHGAERCEIECVVQLDEARRTALVLDESAEDLLSEEPEIMIRRVIEPSGKSKFFLNGRLAAAGVVQSLMAQVLDFAAQHEHQSLLETSRQRDLLDAFSKAEAERATVGRHYTEWKQSRNALDSFEKAQKTILARVEELRVQLDELTAAGLSSGERAELDAEHERLRNRESVLETLGRLVACFDDADGGLDSSLRRAKAEARQLAHLDKEWSEIEERLDGLQSEVADVRFSLSRVEASYDGGVERLEEIRERISELSRLERKYRKSEDELIAYSAELATEVAGLERQLQGERALRDEEARLRKALQVAEAALTKKRKAGAARLSTEVEKGLAQLNMPKAKFYVDIASQPSSAEGADAVEFLLAANPGEPKMPLKKVASGGELSRILLVLKTLVQEVSNSSVQVFDEIDTGVGGAVAQIVGEKLKQVAERAQVIVITHSPQIASMADQHFLIEKRVSDDRTTSSIRLLGHEERVGHVAQMLAGKVVTRNFESSARELLGRAAPD